MKRLGSALGFLWVSVFVLGCGDTPTSPPPPPPADAGPTAIDWTALDAVVEGERVKLQSPGVAFVVVHEGKVVYAHGFGTRAGSDVPIKTSTLFRVSSIAKAWTAMAVLKLVDQGKLGLDDPVKTHIPELALKGSPPELASLTIRQLLLHRSGIYDGVADGTQAGVKDDGYLERYVTSQAFADTYYFMTPPGRTFNYTNVEYNILGLVLERVTGKRYRDVVRELVFEPLGMSRMRCTPDEVIADGDYTDGKGEVMYIGPAVDWSPATNPSGGGAGCAASADDLAKLAALIADGNPNVLSPAAWSAIHESGGPTDQPWLGDRYHGYAYGYGAMSYDGLAAFGAYYPMRIIGHEGAGRGFASLMYSVPARRLAIVALANGNEAYFDDSLAAAIRLAGLPAASEKPATGVPPSTFPRFEGNYYEPRVLKDIVVRSAGGALVADISGLGISGRALTPEHGTGFELLNVPSGPNNDHFVRFIDDGAGNVELMRNRYWVATKQP